MAHWYTAPAHNASEDPESTDGTHPCRTGGCRGVRQGMARVHAYDPPEAPTTCLVGTGEAVTVAGWSNLTLQEAKDHFETFYGRAPSEAEVY